MDCMPAISNQPLSLPFRFVLLWYPIPRDKTDGVDHFKRQTICNQRNSNDLNLGIFVPHAIKRMGGNFRDCYNSELVNLAKLLRKHSLLLGKSIQIQEHLKLQSGEENSSSGHFNPVGRLQLKTTHRLETSPSNIPI